MDKFVTQQGFTSLTIDLEIIQRPLQFLSDFFYEYPSPDAHKAIARMIEAMIKGKNRKKIFSQAANITYFYEKMVMLAEVCWLIHSQEPARSYIITEEVSKDQQKLFEPCLFAPIDLHCKAWDYFPRYLKIKELLCPYRVLWKFFKYMPLSKWKENLNIMLHNALSRNPISISNEDLNVYQLANLLHKLVDACNVIYVRELNSTSPDNNLIHNDQQHQTIQENQHTSFQA